MTEERLKEIEASMSNSRLVKDFRDIEVANELGVQELIDEVRFLQAALADARKESVVTEPSSFGKQLIEAMKIRRETDPGAPDAIVVRAD